jgi:hypothetical protein
MDKELERLQKEINGAEVTFYDIRPDNGRLWNGLDAVLLFPPDGDTVTVKPYGYTPEQLLEYSDGRHSLQDIEDPTFCFSSVQLKACQFLPISEEQVLSQLSKMALREEFDLGSVMRHFKQTDTGHAYCPYG